MRLDPKRVHPSIFKATDGFRWSAQVVDGSSSTAKAVANHQRVWFQQYGRGCLAYVAFAVVTFGASIPLAQSMEKPWKVFIILGMMALIAGVGLVAFLRNLRQMAVPELEALLPILDLTEAQRAYAETVVALERSGAAETEIDETMEALNALLDEEARLTESRNRLVSADVESELANLDAERAKLVERTAHTRDEGAKAAFEQSLGLLDERRALCASQETHVERIDAHLELLRQAVLATRDAARRLRNAPQATIPDLASDSLRSAVALARAQTQATEQALAELKSIG